MDSISKRIILITTLVFSTLTIFGQTPGLIYKPATGAGAAILDPNGDGYTSLTTFGFENDDWTESEIPFVPIPQPMVEPTSDLGPGPDCRFTDFVDTGDEETWYSFLDAFSNWIFRIRLGATAPNSKGYALFIDTDQKFGFDGPNADPNAVSGNPGFEIEINLQTNFGVAIYDIDGTLDGTEIGNREVDRPYEQHCQKSIALTENCGDPDYFYDFFLNFSDITAAFPTITPSTPLRMVFVTVMNPNMGIGNNALSDIGGIDDNAYGYNLDLIFDEIIGNQTPTSPSDANSGFEDRTECPTITEANPNTGVVSGTSTEADGTVITVYEDGVDIGSTTVTAGTWALSGLLLTEGLEITATADAVDKGVSIDNCSSMIVSATCTDPLAAGTVSLCGNGKGFVGDIGSGTAGASIIVRLDGSIAAPGAGTPTVTVAADGSWFWSCNNNSSCGTGSPCLGGYNASGIGTFVITQQVAGQCESAPSFVCFGTTTTSADVTGVTNPITTTTSTVSGSGVSGAQIFMYIDNVYYGSTTVSGTTWSFNGLNLNECEELSFIQLEPDKCPSNTVIGGTVEGSASSNAPTITSSHCISSPTTVTVTGSANEQENTVIEVFKAGAVSQGTTTLDAFGNWSIDVSVTAGDIIFATAENLNYCESVSDYGDTITIGTASTNAAAITGIYTEGDAIVTGTGVSGDTVRLYIDGSLVYFDAQETIPAKAKVDGTGAWTISGLHSNALYAGGILTVTTQTGSNCESAEFDSNVVQCNAPSTTNDLEAIETEYCAIIENAEFTLKNSTPYVIYTPVLASNTDSIIGYSTLGTGGDIQLTTIALTDNPTDVRVKAVKISSLTCESINDSTLSLSIYPLPDQTLNVTESAAAICPNDSIVITIELAEQDITYYLLNEDNGDTIGESGIGANANLTLNSGPVASTMTILVRAVDETKVTQCGADLDDEVILTVAGPSVDQNVTIDNATICPSNNVTISVSTVNDGYSYQIYQSSDNSPLGTAFIGDGTIISRIDNSVTADENYYVEITGASCTSRLTNEVSVTVNPLPTATTSGGGTVCDDGSTTSVNISFTGTSPWNFTYTDGVSSYIINNNTDNPYVITTSTAGTYEVTAITDANCTGTDFGSSATVTVESCVPVIVDATTSIAENASNGDAVYDVNDDNTGNDTDVGGEAITYSITGGNADGIFAIDPATGAITIADNTNLDYESATSYTLTIQASDGTNTDLASITINITNVNDNNPVIVDATTTIAENASNGDAVYNVNDDSTGGNTDADGEALTFSITAGNTDGIFAIDPATGIITIADNTNLDYESATSYTLTIQASDGTNTDLASITVNITNVNDNNPVIVDATTSIAENASNGDAVYNVNNDNTGNDTDADGEAITYSITGGNADGIFAIDPATGAITIADNTNLDYESATSYTLTIQASDGTNTDLASITVNITNVNDNNPVIVDATTSIAENASNGDAVYNVNDDNTGNDADADGEAITYSITGGNADDIFAIDPATGAITIADNTNLDYESATSYTLTIQASDGTNTDLASITVNITNVNDNNPVIVDATTSIAENASNGDAVYDVNDDNTGGNTDADGEALTFSITAGNADGIFTIDPATGAITVGDNTNLDFETTNSYVLTVQASDGTNTDVASITINITNVNDNNPVIVDATTSIAENASNGDAVYNVKDDNTGGNTDADGEALTFSITAGNTDGIFAIDPATGAITIADNSNLDYESATSYTLTIQASDGTNTDLASITINITNVNDNNPVIVDATTSIAENASNGDAVYNVNDDNTGNDTDADGEAITYSITGGNADGIFAIDPATGIITIADNTNLDYESATSYTLTIQASDGTNTDLASITVNITNVNDNNPVIVDATTSIAENASNGDAVYNVNDDNTGNDTDADGEAITYSITGGNADGIFAIDPATGIITIADNTNLDYESATSYTLTIQTSDGTNTDLASITVNITNVNDNNPVIVDATTSIAENASNGDAVYNVNDDNTGNDTDADGEAITYSITGGNADGIFAIDPVTGIITIADNTNLDYESATSYTLTIQASDGTNTDLASITVNITNVNDNNPVIVDATASIAENASNGDAVYNVNDDNTGNDTDADGEAITYSITGGNADGIFTIDPATGAITVGDNTNLDFETTNSYVLTVQASDGTNTDVASITINITDVAENGPVIADATTSIPEDAANTTAVYDVNDDNSGVDTDADGQALTYSITAGNADGIFGIDAGTGAITVVDNTNLDYEANTSYVLTVQAEDTDANTDLASITINITNVNDNNPIIVDATTSIAENASNDDAVYNVNDDNTGNDTDADGEAITYSITGGNADGIFTIDPATGAITVGDNTNLDFETTNSYVLTVQASDGTNTDVASITINITDVAENGPVIADATISIPEDAANTTAVYDVNDDNSGVDTDADGQALTYSIIAGNADGIFGIDAGTGAITVVDNTNLDYESTTSYVLTVQAEDTDANTDLASITINITNVNDNNPVIVDATTSIAETASNGDAVYDVNDDNTGGNTDADGEALTFSITAGNDDGIFAIDPATGAITVGDNTNLDFETTNSYVLTVQASDGTNTDVANITINITDVAENGPVIADATTSIPEDAANTTAVYDVNDDNSGVDTDADGQALTYNITAGNADGIFDIDAGTGAITVVDNTNLDYEATTSYVLTVQAEDTDANTDLASITINITNVNDNNPVIVDATTSIAETASNGDAVYNVNDDNTGGNTDADGEALTFSITAGNDDGIFAIDPATGAITVGDNTNLDFETTNSYVLTVQASDGTNTDVANITINITDVAENGPVIADATTSIPEDAANTTAVYDVNDDNSGVDTDADGQALTYSITAGNADGIFGIDAGTGAISVVDNTNLDYEATTSYVLTVQAEDTDANTDNADITINITDVAENNPVIVDFTTSISEAIANGTDVYDANDDNTGNDTDLDGQALTYSITSGNGDGVFAIDGANGQITIADNATINFNTTPSYTLVVEAQDTDANTDNATITINVTQVVGNPPVIVDFTTSIAEDAGNGTNIYDVNDDNTGNDTDQDGQALTYSITAGNADGIFGIDAGTGAISVVDNTNLDYEATTSYVLTVQAEDTDANIDNADITINITDVAENNPVIVDFTTSISEAIANGTDVYDVNDDNTGNDTDLDGQALTYSITSGNGDGVFAIDGANGQITIADNATINFNTTPSYTLVVEAQDTDANTDNATITINVTQVVGNPPVIVDFTTSIAEDAGNGTSIYDVNDDNTGNDTDQDGQALTYSITAGNADGIFGIDAGTGAITIVDNTNLDYESTTSYVLTVQAEDTDANTDNADITINITDVAENNPVIVDFTTSISEVIANGTDVYDVNDDNTGNDTDLDGQALTYSITSGNGDGVFAIDGTSGQITIADNSTINFNTTPSYTLVVEAQDTDANTDNATITINVTQVVGNPPVIVDFTTSIAEDAGNGTNIYDVNDDNTGNDTDQDGQALTYSITAGNADGIFGIDAGTGAITVVDNTNLDYESTTSYVLTVQAEDTDANTDLASITINITDVAENNPVIVDFTTSISEVIANGTDVYDVNDDNTGNDTDLDGQALTYSITSGNGDGVFAIDGTSGQITIADNSTINFNTTPSYTLVVEAQDTDANTDNATITINVTQVVGNPPVIVDFTTSIAEDAGNGTNIYDVNDDNTGNDTDQDGQALTYSITAGNTDGIFGIDAGTGAITVVDNTNLNYEATTSYVLTVQAEDTDANTDNADITINITDVAESNNPDIADGSAYIDEDADNETFVYDVNDENTNDDIDADGQVLTYQIVEGNNDGIFTINANNGEISIIDNTNLNFDNTDRYNLSIQASDPDNNTDEAIITIYIIDKIESITVPEGFSPNSDGYNDFFEINGVTASDKVDIKIYNRWGTLVYENNNYKNDWDGKANANLSLGNELPSGTYFYIIHINGNSKELSGNVYMKR